MNERIALSATEAAEASSTSRSTIYRWMKRADCDFAVVIGGRRLILRDRFERWLERQCEQG